MPPPAKDSDESTPRYHGWRVVIVCFAMAVFGWGFGFYGHSVYLAELQRLHGWPSSLIAGASTIYYLCGAVLVAFTGDAVERFGPRRFVLFGVVCMSAGATLLTAVAAPWQMYLAYLVMAFGWAALGLASINTLLGMWFRTRRGLAISLALNGASFGGVVFAPVLVLLSERWGFAQSMWIATAAMLVVLVPLVAAWIRRPPDALAPPSLNEVSPGAPRGRWTKAMALRDARFWTVVGPFALALIAQVGFIVHQIAFLSPLVGRSGAAWAVAITTTMAVVGRVGLGIVIDRLNQRIVSALSFASQAAALIVMTQSDSAAVLFAACAVFGFSVGNLITFPALIIQREFDAASFGTLISLATAICQFTYAFGPGVLGLVRDASGSYAAALVLCAVLNALAAAVILARPRNSVRQRA